MTPPSHPVENNDLALTVAEIDHSALLQNLDVFRAKGAEVMAVVKADAYGHGAVLVAATLRDAGIRHFAVATLPEAIELRKAGITGRILVFAAPLPEHIAAYTRHDLDLTISSGAVAERVREEVSGSRLRVHVKIDTGMGRIGIRPDEAERIVRDLDRDPNVEIAGIWTHFASADEPDLDFTHQQLERFLAVVDRVGTAAESVHAANSPAALRVPESYAFDRSLIRIGIGLYGYTDLKGLAQKAGLQPVMRVTSHVTHTKWVEPGTTVSYGRHWHASRRTRIATVGAGYADGYPRNASDRAAVNIGGQRHPVIGTVCMDMFMVDVGERTDIAEGDEVILFGPEGPDAFELATICETIPYEVLTRVARRVRRVHRYKK